MSDPATHGWPVARPAWARPVAVSGGLVLLIAAVVPPLSSEARRYEYVEALQFSLLALAVPALLVVGAPWRVLGLAKSGSVGDGDDHVVPAGDRRFFDRLAGARRRHLGLGRSLGFAGLEIAVLVLWRLPVAVNALVTHAWLTPLEGACLLFCGIGLWLELVSSPPVIPRSSGPRRVLLAALVMWTVWITAYLVGLSETSVYRAYRHVPGVGLSLLADQEIATFVLWFAAAAAFVPVIFASLVTWLRSEDDPDEGLHRLVRDARRRALTPLAEREPPAAGGQVGPTG